MRNNKNLALVVICALLLAIFLSGCSNTITEGEIYKMEHRPERTETILMPITHTVGQTVLTTYIPCVYNYPERYVIYIQSFEVDDTGKKETAIYYTTKEVYEQCKVGDVFSYDRERDSADEPVEKNTAAQK